MIHGRMSSHANDHLNPVKVNRSHVDATYSIFYKGTTDHFFANLRLIHSLLLPPHGGLFLDFELESSGLRASCSKAKMSKQSTNSASSAIGVNHGWQEPSTV